MPTNGEIGYTTLGKSDLQVSRLCFGTWHLGSKSEHAAALDLLGEAYDRGINFFDTSDNYRSEGLIGLAIRDGTIPKDKVLIATKTGAPVSEYEARSFAEQGKEVDTSGERLRRQVEKSLRLLGVDVVHLYQTHVYDPKTPSLEVVVTMNDLIKEGKILHYGFSNYGQKNIIDAVRACDENRLTRPVSLQPSYSLGGWGSEEAIKTAREYGMSILAFSPLHKGFFTDKQIMQHHREDTLQEAAREKFRQLQAFAEDHGRNIQQLAIAWLMHQEGVIPILGTYRSEHLEDLVKAADWKLDDEAISLIDKVRAEAFAIFSHH